MNQAPKLDYEPRRRPKPPSIISILLLVIGLIVAAYLSVFLLNAAARSPFGKCLFATRPPEAYDWAARTRQTALCLAASAPFVLAAWIMSRKLWRMIKANRQD